jgi:hypothetical protein
MQRASASRFHFNRLQPVFVRDLSDFSDRNAASFP